MSVESQLEENDGLSTILKEEICRESEQLTLENVTKLTLLHRAVCSEISENIDYVLTACDGEINATTEYGHTPLHFACYKRKADVVHALLNHGAEVNVIDANGWTLLHLCALEGYEDIATLMLQHGMDRRLLTVGNYKPIHLACARGHMHFVQYLLEFEDSVAKSMMEQLSSATSNERWTPLHIACINGHVGIVDLLLQNGADSNICDAKGYTPAQHAVLDGHIDVLCLLLPPYSALSTIPGVSIQFVSDLDVLRDMPHDGADNETGGHFTALHWAAQEGKTNLAKLLIDKNYSANIVADRNVSPLHLASSSGHVDMVELLLTHGADTHKVDDKKWSPLHVAACNGHSEIVSLLIQHGSVIDAQDTEGETPLLVACQSGHADVVNTLLNNNADMQKSDAEGFTSLHWAAQEGKVNVAKLLIERNHDVNLSALKSLTPLRIASEFGFTDIVTLLLSHGADVRKTDDQNWTSLHAAACNGHTDIVYLLLNHGAELDSKVQRGGTPLLLASENGHLDTVDVLLKFNADVQKADAEGFTALHWAAQFGHSDIAHLLIDNGAEVNAQSALGCTPLMLACQFRHTDIVQMLLGKKADVKVQDVDGCTCLHWALQADDNESDTESTQDFSSSTTEDHKPPTQDVNCSNDASYVNDSASIIHLLIGNAAIVNLADDDGCTPIHVAAEAGRLSDIVLLAQNGANVSWQSSDGKSALMLAAGAGQLETVQLLISLGADHISTSIQNMSAAQLAILNGHIEVYEYLINLTQLQQEPAIDANWIEARHDHFREGGLTALHAAVMAGLYDDVTSLLNSNNRLVNSTDFEGNTPLHIAVCRHLALTKLLVERGAVVNYQNMHGISPLHVAVACDNMDIIQYLLEHDADVTASDNWRLCPLYYGTHLLGSKNEEIVESLRQPFFHNRHSSNRLQTGANDYIAVDQLGNSPLHRVMCMESNKGLAKVSSPQKSSVEQLLINYPNSIDSANVFGHTPLHMARSPKIIEKCIPFLHEASFTTKDNLGRNFWHLLFCHRRANKLTELLLSNIGTQCLDGLRQQDHKGRTPLHYNAMHVNDGWLLQEVQDDQTHMGLTDAYGRVPVAYAAIYQNREKFNVMLQQSHLQLLDNFFISGNQYNNLGEKALRDYRECKEQHFSSSRKLLGNFNKFIQLMNCQEPRLSCVCLHSFDDEVSFISNIWKDIRYQYSTIGGESVSQNASTPSNSSSFSSIRDLVSDTVADLLKRVAVLDERFDGKVELAGSALEDTKVDCCDEFDFLVVLTRLSEICAVVTDGTSVPGYVFLRKRDDVANSSLSFDDFFNSHGKLDTHLIKFQFEVLVKKVLSQSESGAFWP